MCGIVGAISERNITTILVECLKRLEYRGYDSAGVATINDKNTLKCVRAVGKIEILANKLKTSPISGRIGIAHTRWATHGAPTKHNAHPHTSNGAVALTHNGIIENYEKLRDKLIKKGVKFDSDTDTEVIVHLIYSHLQNKDDFLTAVHKTIKELTGAYALAIISTAEPDKIIAVRSGSPVVIGLGIDENFIASDATALLPVTNSFMYLQEGDIAVVEKNKVQIYNSKLKRVKRPIKSSEMSSENVERGNYRHFMQKEIFEQPRALADTLEERLLSNEIPAEVFGNNAKAIFSKAKRLQIVACGSSFHAAMTGKYWFEKHTRIPCNVEIASEFRYRDTITEPGTIFITISQSGETADTLAALHKAKKLPYLATLTICNAPESSLVRESDLVFITRAGLEIGVATTKAFTSQLTALLMLTIALGKYQGMNTKVSQQLIKQLKHLPLLAEQILKLDHEISIIAKVLENSSNAFYLGRGISYPVAMEGALKIKEISYIHAECYPAGELKHGALALIDHGTPVVVVAPNDHLFEKLKSNLQEVHARGGELIIFADKSLHFKKHPSWHICHIPPMDVEIAPIIYSILLQLLAYHVALLKGTDIDQPRNLAKSVTVE
ncbi:MAG: glutamine--fructose-6-phosphate transaminase (isomerizing) [Gammaproteobacteria bacterium]|nr:glutamine--fructose-6-phosphate transaminase (isomerizing) [Gammaproteobacteria bacterium]